MIPNSKEDRIRLSKKKYRDNHKKQRMEYNKQYLMKHPEKKKEYGRRAYLHRRKRAIEYSRKYRKLHIEKITDYNKEYSKLHRGEINTRQNIANRRIKRSVLELFGGKCACCGENRFEFLTMDHINDDGKEHRKRGGELWHADGVYRWALKNSEKALKILQILCWNCQMAKAFFGACPHRLINYDDSLNLNLKIE